MDSSIYKNNRDYNEIVLKLIEDEFSKIKLHTSKRDEFLNFVSSLESLLNSPADRLRELYKVEIKQDNQPIVQVPRSRHCIIM